jgi:hypothetical protein
MILTALTAACNLKNYKIKKPPSGGFFVGKISSICARKFNKITPNTPYF